MHSEQMAQVIGIAAASIVTTVLEVLVGYLAVAVVGLVAGEGIERRYPTLLVERLEDGTQVFA
ncbi:hypothetical protein D3C79_999760 [compost metagenome]